MRSERRRSPRLSLSVINACFGSSVCILETPGLDVGPSVQCMIKIFRGGGEGVVDGDSNEGCLKWGVGVIKGSVQKHLYRRWVKAKLVCRGF